MRACVRFARRQKSDFDISARRNRSEHACSLRHRHRSTVGVCQRVIFRTSATTSSALCVYSLFDICSFLLIMRSSLRLFPRRVSGHFPHFPIDIFYSFCSIARCVFRANSVPRLLPAAGLSFQCLGEDATAQLALALPLSSKHNDELPINRDANANAHPPRILARIIDGNKRRHKR